MYKVHKPPMMEAVCKALADVKQLLKPPCLRGMAIKNVNCHSALHKDGMDLNYLPFIQTPIKHWDGKMAVTGTAIHLWLCQDPAMWTLLSGTVSQRWAKAYIADCSALHISKNGMKCKTRIKQ